MRNKANSFLIIFVSIVAVLMFSGCSGIAKDLNQKNIPKDDSLRKWQTYENTEYDYSLKYPRGWTVKEINRYDEVFEVQVKYVLFSDGKDYDLIFYFYKQDEYFSPGRSEIGEGKFENQRIIKVENIEIKVKDLISEGKKTEMFFSGNNKEFRLGGYLSYKDNADKGDNEFSQEKTDTAMKIIKSLSIK